MEEKMIYQDILVNAPFETVWRGVSNPLRFPTIYPSWTISVSKLPDADNEVYEGVDRIGGAKFKIVPKPTQNPKMLCFEIAKENGNVEEFHVIGHPLNAEDEHLELLTVRWEAEDAFQKGFMLGKISADLRNNLKKVIEPDAKEVEDTPRRYPVDLSHDEILSLLHESQKDGKPDIPAFARQMLERLQQIGLLHTMDEEPPVNVKKVRLVKEDKEQEVWVRFDTIRSFSGYMAVDVVDPPKSDAAILAAMIALLAEPIDFEQILEALQFWTSADGRAQGEKINEIMKRMEEGQYVTFEEWKVVIHLLFEQQAKIKSLRCLKYIRPLLQYYKPEAINYSRKEFRELMKQTCVYIKDYLEALRKLHSFLEYGVPNRNLTPIIQEPQRDVAAVILADVHGLTHRNIGEQMRIPLPESSRRAGGHITVRKMIKRGREILEGAFGEEGWQRRAEAMKAEKAWWWALSKEERAEENDIMRFALD